MSHDSNNNIPNTVKDEAPRRATVTMHTDAWSMQRPDLMQMIDWTDPKFTATATVVGPRGTQDTMAITWPTITTTTQETLQPTPDKSPFQTWVDTAQTVKHAYTFLETAVLEMKNRAAQRDTQDAAEPGKSGERSMSATIKAFNALTGHDLTEEEGWEFMILLKLVRGRQGDFRADDYVDAAAYSGLLGECASKTRGQ